MYRTWSFPCLTREKQDKSSSRMLLNEGRNAEKGTMKQKTWCSIYSSNITKTKQTTQHNMEPILKNLSTKKARTAQRRWNIKTKTNRKNQHTKWKTKEHENKTKKNRKMMLEYVKNKENQVPDLVAGREFLNLLLKIYLIAQDRMKKQRRLKYILIVWRWLKSNRSMQSDCQTHPLKEIMFQKLSSKSCAKHEVMLNASRNTLTPEKKSNTAANLSQNSLVGYPEPLAQIRLGRQFFAFHQPEPGELENNNVCWCLADATSNECKNIVIQQRSE